MTRPTTIRGGRVRGGRLVPALALALAWLLVAPLNPSAAPAQTFPFDDTLDELEERAERLAQRQAHEEERQRQLAELAEENRERWETFQRQLPRMLREYVTESRRHEAAELRQAINRQRRSYELATILLALGDLRAAETVIERALRRQADEPSVQRGWFDVLKRRLELISRFYGDTWSSSRAARLEQQVGRYDAELAQLVQGTPDRGDRRERERRHTEFRAWLEEVADYVEQRESLLEAVQRDTFNGERIWQLAQVLADNLYQHAEARAWIELMIEHCSDHWIVESGLAQAGRARLLAKQGWLDVAQRTVRPLGSTCQAFFDGIPSQAEPIQERAREAQEKGLPANLTPRELWLLEMLDDRRRQATRRAVARRIREFEEEIGEIAQEYRNAAGAE